MTAIEQSSLQRVEHARDAAAYLHNHPRLQSALLGYKVALLAYKEALEKFEEGLDGDLNADESQPPNGQSLRLLSPLEVCQELGEERTVVDQRLKSGEIPALKLGHALKVRQADLQEYMNRQHHLSSLGEEDSFRER